MNANETHGLPLPDGPSDHPDYAKDNFCTWECIAGQWDVSQSSNGNDMFSQCLVPTVLELAASQDFSKRVRVLDLGTGTGILARAFARKGARVTGLDFSEQMLDKAREWAKEDNLAGRIDYGCVDLMDYAAMERFILDKERFDVITISTTIKSLSDLTPLAKALPLMLKPEGRIIVVDLHPAFSKPAGHRGMEVFEDPETGKQQLQTHIKVLRYLNIPPVKSEAVRGQTQPLWFFHRPMCSLMEPFFLNGLVLDAMREPAFGGEPVPSQAQSYHNFQQTPMLLALRFCHGRKT